MKRFFTVFHKEFSGVHEAAYLLGIFALLSQILALIRDRALAHMFGASSDLDIYYAAFRIPDFLFVSLASLAGAYVLIPFLLQKKEEGVDEAREFLSGIFTALFTLMAVLAVVLYFALPFLAPLIAPGFSPDAQDEFVFLSRILLLSPFFLGFSNLLGSITQASKKFFVFAVSPVMYNLGIILGIFLFAPRFGVRGIVAGVILGAMLHLVIQLPAVFREKLFPRFGVWRVREAIQVFAVSLPRTAALSASHFSILILAALASLVSSGSVSVFQFAYNLESVPLSIIGVSYSVAAFPTLAKAFGAGKRKEFLEQISVAARHIIFWSLPVMCLFIVLRAQIVRVILGSGAFNWEHTRLTAAALALFVVSLLAQNLVLLFARAYYAAGNTKRPVYINIISSSIAVLSGFWLFSLFTSSPYFQELLESLLRVEGVYGAQVIVLPLAFTLGMTVNAFLLWNFFQRDYGRFPKKMSLSFFQSLVASLGLSVVAWTSLNIFDDMFNLNTFLGVFAQGFFAGMLGIITGVAILSLLKNEELADTTAALRRKFWKSNPVGSEQEGM